jgi:hypothetical protein
MVSREKTGAGELQQGSEGQSGKKYLENDKTVQLNFILCTELLQWYMSWVVHGSRPNGSKNGYRLNRIWANEMANGFQIKNCGNFELKNYQKV